MVENLPILNLIVTVAVAAGSAWGATKFTLKAHEKTLKKHDDAFERIEASIKGLVPNDVCRSERSECRSDRESITCELSRKMDRMFDAIAEQDRRREIGKDAYHLIFMEIKTELASIASTVEAMRTQPHG